MKTKEMTRLAMMVALTVTLSIMFIIPIPATKGFVTLCEVGIYASALLFGPTGGLLVGALSGGLIDLISGYPEWAIFSIVIHGFQGFLLGYLYNKFSNKKGLFLGFSFASLFMIIGYALATALLYGWAAGLASLPGNAVQNIFGIAVTLPLFQALQKVLRHPQYK
ncbi:ECF transporter S component [Enterococcus xiangfangensis]|uniref:ECF transporter S component n=1 Tax=Enterococcus xiangfangensis TaxID=1296537 RepID=A0ABU3FDA1_9ENTE|nr:ECF transporter S component [Enterococcus xiangfangensis]MDT2760669.1 ECF transporter S component [Enterococcus xiangfangensis]